MDAIQSDTFGDTKRSAPFRAFGVISCIRELTVDDSTLVRRGPERTSDKLRKRKTGREDGERANIECSLVKNQGTQYRFMELTIGDDDAPVPG